MLYSSSTRQKYRIWKIVVNIQLHLLMMLAMILKQKKLFKMSYRSQLYQKLDMQKLSGNMCYEIMCRMHLGVEFAYKDEVVTNPIDDNQEINQDNHR